MGTAGVRPVRAGCSLANDVWCVAGWWWRRPSRRWAARARPRSCCGTTVTGGPSSRRARVAAKGERPAKRLWSEVCQTPQSHWSKGSSSARGTAAPSRRRWVHQAAKARHAPTNLSSRRRTLSTPRPRASSAACQSSLYVPASLRWASLAAGRPPLFRIDLHGPNACLRLAACS